MQKSARVFLEVVTRSALSGGVHTFMPIQLVLGLKTLQLTESKNLRDNFGFFPFFELQVM